jgi:hypothetical protein
VIIYIKVYCPRLFVCKKTVRAAAAVIVVVVVVVVAKENFFS